MPQERISGTVAAMVTPRCQAGEELDREAVEGLLEFYANSARRRRTFVS
jgi:hypothetical protein